MKPRVIVMLFFCAMAQHPRFFMSGELDMSDKESHVGAPILTSRGQLCLEAHSFR